MRMKNTQNSIFYHLALWLPIALATPLIIFIQNPDDFTGQLLTQVLLLLTATCFLTLTSWLIVNILPSPLNKLVVSLILAFATALVIQGYIVHGLIDFGQLDGSIINWKGLGPIYRTEYKAILLALIILTILYLSLPKILKSISSLLIIFSLAQLLIVLPSYFQREAPVKTANDFDDSVYEFSSEKNIIHILADGFQADLVKQVFEDNPELAKEFTGFNFFDNHLGRFQGTAPTIPSILTGKFFDLNQGYNPESTRINIENNSYTNTLLENNYRLDYVTISNIHCNTQAHSCINRSFNDLKSRGFAKENVFSSIMLLFDISLFRHSPLYLKKRIHDNGAWLFSVKLSSFWSKYPDPVIREWTNNMVVKSNQPMYKWYHFIGTHIPAQWDENCQYIGRQPQSREFYKAQTHCVLKGMGNLFNKMKLEGIYDNSIIVINGDHGCNVPANDLYGVANNSSVFTDSFIGVTRPVFMMKKKQAHQPLNIHSKPTRLIDIAPSILSEAGLNHSNFMGESAFVNEDNRGRGVSRTFNRYVSKTFWGGDPIGFDEYQVTGDIKDRGNWELIAMNNRTPAPSLYEYMSFDTAYDFSKGISLSKAQTKTQKEAYIFGTEFYILLSDIPKKAQKVSMTLQVPPYSRGQSISLSVNNKQISDEILLNDKGDEWITQDIHIPENTLKAENNLFKFEFSKAGISNAKRPVSVKIRSIYLY
jgi:hypothetical protein